jgi:DNA-binding XRE family transcriptional regulator
MDGDGLRVIREGHGLTQAQMAKELGVSRQSYIAWEKDKYKMPADKLAILLGGSETLKAAKPKETAKQRQEREKEERALIKHWRNIYRVTRAWPQWNNHTKAMALLASQGHTIPPCAYATLVEDFPDILTDPNGDYTMTKAQSMAALNPNQET